MPMMSDSPLDGSWWLGVDGKWYPPEDWPDGHAMDPAHTAAGRGWQMASDGRWYPPADKPTLPASGVTQPTGPNAIATPTTPSTRTTPNTDIPTIAPIQPAEQGIPGGAQSQWGQPQSQWGEPRAQWGRPVAGGPIGHPGQYVPARSPVSVDDSSTGVVAIRSIGGALFAAITLGLGWYLLVSELARRYVYLTGFGFLIWALLFLGGRSVAFFVSDQRRRIGVLPGIIAAALSAAAIIIANRYVSDTMMIPSKEALFGNDDLNFMRQFGPPVVAALGGISALRTKWQVIDRRVTTASFGVVMVAAIVLAGLVVWRSDAPLRTTPLFDDSSDLVRTPRSKGPLPTIAPPTTIDFTQDLIKKNAEAFERDRANRELQARVTRCTTEKHDFLTRIDAVANQRMFYEELTTKTRGEFFELKLINPHPDGDGTITFEWRLEPIGEVIC